MDILLKSTSITKDVHNCLRVKGGKGKKGSKRGTKAPLEHFARAEQIFEFGKPCGRISNKEGFNQFGQSLVKFKDSKGRTNWKIEPTLFLRPQRKTSKMLSIGDFSKDMLSSVNNILRNVLLFKGIGFSELYERVRVEGAQTFNVNTSFELLYLRDKAKERGAQIDRVVQTSHYIHSITVKKVWKNVIFDAKGQPLDTTYSILFCSKTCKPINIFLAELNTTFNF